MRIIIICLLCLACALDLCFGQSANDRFNPDANNNVYTLAVQSDGRIVLGGVFTTIGGVGRQFVARIHDNGRIDTGFNAGIFVGAYVGQLCLQPDGKVLVGGNFQHIAGQARSHIARLNSDGSLDSGFNPGTDDSVYALAVQSDGKIIVGGFFITIAGQTNQCLARLNSNGTFDATFRPVVNMPVYHSIVQPDGRILICGEFTAVNGQTRSRIARLNPDGTLDSSFMQTNGANSSVFAMALQPDGKILLGGIFSQAGGQTRSRIARLNSDGTLDTAFNPGVVGGVNSLMVQPDGKILVGGIFSALGGVPRSNIGRLHPDGLIDFDYAPPGEANGYVYAVALQSDGKAVLGGTFTEIGGVLRNRIARLYPTDGRVDQRFNPEPNAAVYATAFQPDRNVLVGGLFTSLQTGTETRNRLARLYQDDKTDVSFFPSANERIYGFAVQPGGEVIAFGMFTAMPQPCGRIAQFDKYGVFNASFSGTAPDGAIYGLAQQADGRLVVIGDFSTLCGQPRQSLGRLTANGLLDAGFTAVVNGGLRAVAMQPDGKILIGGSFTQLSGQAQTNIARLNANGSLDSTFKPLANNWVLALALQSDGKILLGGLFTTLNGQPCQGIGRLNADGTLDADFHPQPNAPILSIQLQADGKILVGGTFTTIGGLPRVRVARLNTDGTADADYALPGGANNSVNSIMLEPDGKLMVGGYFDTLGGLGCKYLGRLSSTEAALQNLSVNASGSVVAWQRSGSSPEVWRTTFEYSSDGTTWTSLGAGTRVAGGWQLGGLALPFQQNFYVRARGYATCGLFNGSCSICESVRLFYLAPLPIYPVPADFDGDGLADPTVYDARTGGWRVRLSAAGYHLVNAVNFLGGSGWLPVAADFDGDGLADPGVCQTATGNWKVRLSSLNYVIVEVPGFVGGYGWLPVANQYDADHFADPGAYEQGTGTWRMRLSGNNYSLLVLSNYLGGSSYTPVLGDFDSDGLADATVYQEATGDWQMRLSSMPDGVFIRSAFLGGQNYMAAAADYDGDGATDFGVFQPATGNWKVRISSMNYELVEVNGFLK